MAQFNNEFENYAFKQHGISSMSMHRYYSGMNTGISNYITPTIIEERPLNVTQMDVFSRLMMDRIIFMGVPIYDDVANIIQAQLLFLESADPKFRYISTARAVMYMQAWAYMIPCNM
jgi:ATP-dependent Clp protease protease subunit